MRQIDIGHVQLHLTYTLRPDVEEADYDLWVRQTAVPWWEDQPGFRSIRGFYTVVGSGAQRISQIDIDHLESLAKILGSGAFAEMRREFSRFATNVDSRILAPTGYDPS